MNLIFLFKFLKFIKIMLFLTNYYQNQYQNHPIKIFDFKLFIFSLNSKNL